MFLVEAAMGTPTLIMNDDPQLKKAPKGTDSVIAVGQIDPDPVGDQNVQLDRRDVVVPAGRVALSKTPGAAASSFIQSEHLIYDESQVRTAMNTRHQLLSHHPAPGLWYYVMSSSLSRAAYHHGLFVASLSHCCQVRLRYLVKMQWT